MSYNGADLFIFRFQDCAANRRCRLFEVPYRNVALVAGCHFAFDSLTDSVYVIANMGDCFLLLKGAVDGVNVLSPLRQHRRVANRCDGRVRIARNGTL